MALLKSLTINQYFIKNAANLSGKIGVVIFVLLLLASTYGSIKYRLDFVREKVRADEDLIVMSAKIGDFHLLKKYLGSMAKSDYLAKVYIANNEGENLIDRSGTEESSVPDQKGIRSLTLSSGALLITTENAVSDKLGQFWKIVSVVRLDYGVIVWPVVISTLGSLLIFLLLQKMLTDLSFRIARPLKNISADLSLYRQGSASVFDPNQYRTSDRIEELDNLVDELQSSLAEKNRQQNELRRIGVFEAIARLSKQVAHDVRSPIGALLAAANSVESKPFEATEMIKKAVKRLETIITDLYEKKLPYDERETFNLTDLILEIVKEKKLEYKNRFDNGAKIECDFDGAMVFTSFSYKDAGRTISNLLNNSFEAKVADPLVIRISIETQEKFCKISISDDGPGIPELIRKKIFEYGFTFGKLNGDGSGLFYAREVMRNGSGDILLNESAKVGAEFHLYFPLTCPG